MVEGIFQFDYSVPATGGTTLPITRREFEISGRSLFIERMDWAANISIGGSPFYYAKTGFYLPPGKPFTKIVIENACPLTALTLSILTSDGLAPSYPVQQPHPQGWFPMISSLYSGIGVITIPLAGSLTIEPTYSAADAITIWDCPTGGKLKLKEIMVQNLHATEYLSLQGVGSHTIQRVPPGGIPIRFDCDSRTRIINDVGSGSIIAAVAGRFSLE